MSKYFHKILRTVRGQQFVEYLMFFGVVILIGYFAASKGGFLRTGVEESLDTTVESIGCMAADTCPAGGCVPVCGDGCCLPSEKDTCASDCGCSPVDGGWSNWVVDGICTGCDQKYIKTCTNPTPKCGGKTCTGVSSKTDPCGTVNGSWGGSWVDVGACSSCQQLQQQQTCIGAACGGVCSGPYPEQIVPCGQVNGTWSGPWVNIGSCGDPGPCLQEQEKNQCTGSKCGGTCTGARPRKLIACGNVNGVWSGPWVSNGSCEQYKACSQQWVKNQCWGAQCGGTCPGAQPTQYTACGKTDGKYGPWYKSPTSNCANDGSNNCTATHIRDCLGAKCGGTCSGVDNKAMRCFGIWVAGPCSNCAGIGLSPGPDESGNKTLPGYCHCVY